MDPTEADVANLSTSYPFTSPSVLSSSRSAGPQTLGSPVIQPHCPERIFRQRPGATISRPDSPSPFLRQISNGSQHGIGSTQSSPTLQYLSPPIIDSGGETPPYRPDPDDYFSLNMLVHRRKHKTGHRQSDRSGSRDASGSGSTSLHPNDETQSRSPDALACREFKAMNHHGDLLDSALRTLKSSKEKSSEQNATNRSLIPAADQRRPRFSLNSRVSSDPTASNSLVSSDAKESRYGQSSPEHDSIARLGPKRSTLRKRRANNSSEGSGSAKRKGKSTGKLEKPATIVLRKATVLCGATSAVTDHDLQTPARLVIDPEAPTSTSKDLPQDFTADHSGSHAQPPEGLSLLMQRGASNGDAGNHANKKAGFEQERVKTPERLFITSSLARQSIAADPAITAHTAPRTFSITATSQRSSLSPPAQLRRKSAVNIFARGSVHEVIWKEDESVSGCSSDDYSPSPPLSRTDTRIEDGKVDASSRSPVLAETLSASPPSFTVTEMPLKVSPDMAEGKYTRTANVDQDLFGWSWSRRPSTDMNAKAVSANVFGEVTPIDSPQEHRLRKKSTPWRKRSIFIPNVDSFSPRSERKPSDWQKYLPASITFIQAEHTPFIGITPPTPKELATSSPPGGPGKRRRSSSIRSHPYDLARVGQESTEGCAIGSSSHKRRMSHRTLHRRISQPGSEQSKIHSRKTSLMRRISSAVYLHSQAETRALPVDNAPSSKSADTRPYFTQMPGSGPVPLVLTAEPAAEEACRHGSGKSDRPRSDGAGSTFITEPLRLVGTPDARADCESCKKRPMSESTVSVDWIG